MESNKKKEIFRVIKFTLFSASAGIIELGSFSLLEWLTPLPYWPKYLIALILSVLWNFTLNRNFTFKAANNIPVAMLKVALFYAVFTPASTWAGSYLAETLKWNDFIVTILNMLANFVLEYLYDRFFVFGKALDTKTDRNSENKMQIQKVSIIGMGALGLLYADIIQETLGSDAVQFVMDKNRFEKYKNQVFTVNGVEKKFNLVCGDEIKKPCDLLIVAVKSTGLNEKMLELAGKCVGKNTIIISVLNGISSEDVIAEKFGMKNIIHTVAQGMDAMKFGNDLKYTKAGELHIGITNQERKENLDCLEEFFIRSKMPYIVEEDIIRRMWCKWMLNVGVNQTCMVFNATYSMVLNQPELLSVYEGAMREVILLAKAEKINVTEEDLKFYIDITRTLDPDGTPSMGQDRIQKRKSEVEIFAGTVIKKAKEHGIEVPINQMLYEKVQEIEAQY